MTSPIISDPMTRGCDFDRFRPPKIFAFTQKHFRNRKCNWQNSSKWWRHLFNMEGDIGNSRKWCFFGGIPCWFRFLWWLNTRIFFCVHVFKVITPSWYKQSGTTQKVLGSFGDFGIRGVFPPIRNSGAAGIREDYGTWNLKLEERLLVKRNKSTLGNITKFHVYIQWRHSATFWIP